MLGTYMIVILNDRTVRPTIETLLNVKNYSFFIKKKGIA